MPNLAYAREKFVEALVTLATHPGDIRTRLLQVQPLVAVSPAWLPATRTLRKDVEELIVKLKTVEILPDAELVSLAARIVNVEAQLQELREPR
jgi:hypothetical protein